MRLQRQAKQLVEKPALTLSLPRSCTLPDLFDLILSERNLVTQTSIIDAILHSYRLFASADQVLQTVDTKFRDLCYSESLDVDTKLDAIRLLRVFLSRWLQPPHVRDFDSAVGLSYLQRLIRMLADWFSVFRPKSSTCESGRTVILVDGSGRSAAHSHLPCPDYPVIRCMFFNADPTRLERMAHKLDQLGNFAESRFRWAQMHQSRAIPVSPTRMNGGNSTGSLSTPSSPVLTKASTKAQVPSALFSPEQVASFKNIQPSKIAEELTIRDQVLFLQLRLPECLLYARKQPSPTVRATIDQFNRVVCAVQNSILRLQTDSVSPLSQLTASKHCPVCVLRDPSPARVVWSRERLMQRSDAAARNNPVTGDLCVTEADVKRANEMKLWIDVASELDKLSNLSSLHAVLTALQSNPVHRLRHCWAAMDRYYVHHVHKLEGLLTLISHENNYEQLRARINKHIELVRQTEAARWKSQVDKKGRSPSTPKPVLSGRHQVNTDQNMPTIPGIIPYLGLFFQDLTFLNYAFPDGEDSSNSKHLQSAINERPNLASPSGKSITSNLSSPSSSCSSSSASNPSASGDFVNKNMIGNKSRVVITNLTTDVPRSPRSRSAAGVTCKSPKPTKIASDLQPGTLINFEKHMREAEFLKDLYILQYSAESYRLHSDVLYARWFDAFPALTEEEARQLSLEIEPELDSMSSVCQLGKQKKFASEMNLHRVSAVSTYSCSPSDDSRSGQSDSAVACMSVPRSSQSRRPSLLTHPYFDQPTATDASLSSSCSDISPTASSPTVFIPKSTKLRSRPESRPTHVINALTHSNADSTCTLLLPPVPPKRPTSAQKLPNVKICSDDEKTLQVHVKLEDPTFLCAHSSLHLKPPKNTLARGSNPDLSTASKRSPLLLNATTSVTVSSTQTISDLLVRALTNFGIPQVTGYNLILVRPGLPDRLLPMDANAFDTLMQAPTKYKPFANHNGQLIECVCVRQVQGLTSSSTFSGFRQPSSSLSVGNKNKRYQRSLSKPAIPRHLRVRGSLNQLKFPPS